MTEFADGFQALQITRRRHRTTLPRHVNELWGGLRFGLRIEVEYVRDPDLPQDRPEFDNAIERERQRADIDAMTKTAEHVGGAANTALDFGIQRVVAERGHVQDPQRTRLIARYPIAATDQ